jgi:hypothetical protein
MALQNEELFGSPVSQTPNLRAYPDQDGVRPGQLEQLGADAEIAHLTPLSQNAAGTYRVWSTGTAEQTTITSDGTPATAGSFHILVDGIDSGALAFDATAAQIQAALRALPSVGADGVTAAATSGVDLGDASAIVTLTWGGALSGSVEVSLDTAGLTGAVHVAAESVAGVGEGAEIDALLWAPGDPHQGLLAGESLMQRFLAGLVHADDVPLPAGESQGDLDTALASMQLRMKGIKVQGQSLGA